MFGSGAEARIKAFRMAASRFRTARLMPSLSGTESGILEDAPSSSDESRGGNDKDEGVIEAVEGEDNDKANEVKTENMLQKELFNV